MQYQVPQFIEVEDKIFGPFTFKQFLYLAGGGGVCLVFFTLFPLYFAILFSLPFVGLSLGLAFYKVNDRPLIVTIEHAFKYFLSSKLYLWRQHPSTQQKIDQYNKNTSQQKVTLPTLSESRLKDLSWSLNIKDRTKMGVIDVERPGYEM